MNSPALSRSIACAALVALTLAGCATSAARSLSGYWGWAGKSAPEVTPRLALSSSGQSAWMERSRKGGSRERFFSSSRRRSGGL